ncbi:hypothetical protein [Brucella intermedia]|uniref:hypothetical protein n=1 Tax=Brucella intermedia TaxID=94625 RepID=UPI00224AEEFD|nr:hypothetical protein [Brucella intermedia]
MIFLCEARLFIENAEAAIDLAFNSLRFYCVSQSRQDLDYALDFGTARALIRPEPSVLWLRVEADDFTSCHGTKMLIQSKIRVYAKDMPMNMLWIDATAKPFGTIMAHENVEDQ